MIADHRPAASDNVLLFDVAIYPGGSLIAVSFLLLSVCGQFGVIFEKLSEIFFPMTHTRHPRDNKGLL